MPETPTDRFASPSTTTRPPVSPDLAILVLVLIWGTNFSVVMVALREGSPLALIALRFVLASSGVCVGLHPPRATLNIERRYIPTFIGLGLHGNFLYHVLFIYGVDCTLARHAALMLATVPIFVSLFSTLLRHERIGPSGWAGVLLSVAGIGLVVWGGVRGPQFGAETVRGDITMLGAAVALSAYSVGAAPLVERVGPL